MVFKKIAKKFKFGEIKMIGMYLTIVKKKWNQGVNNREIMKQL